MDENPYRSPQAPSQAPSPRIGSRRLLAGVLLSLLAIPSAAIAAFSTCTAALYSLPPSFSATVVVGAVGGTAVAFLVLMLAHRFVNSHYPGERRSANIAGAFTGLLIATPIALAITIVVGGVLIGLDFKGMIGEFAVHAAGILGCLIWCTGIWMGLRWKR